MKISWAILPYVFLVTLSSKAQDSLKSQQLEEVVVTATRTERTLGALPMPVTLVQKFQIKTMGSMRLNDVLTEQTGLAIVPQVNGSGNGLQLQGFNPDYTLILIDGEPLIGRFTGSLELSRVAVGNIKQIEIVKGPSSSLYGSDALAGVVNIITDRPQGTHASVYSRYGSNNTLDLSGNYSLTGSKLGVYLFANRYSTDGYDLSPETFGNTVSPFRNYTGNFKIVYKISPKTDFSFSGRAFEEQQKLTYEVTVPGAEKFHTSGSGNVKDWNLNPVLVHRFTDRLKTTARFYFTRYQTETNLYNNTNDTLYYTDSFKQTFLRSEVNGEYFFNNKNILTVGAGEVFETVQTFRYGDESKRKQQTQYGFFQHEWTPVSRVNIIAGGRYDFNSSYGSQFSPKLSARFMMSKRVSLKGSFGMGFKALDFRQLYFNFNNVAGGGYTVLGTEVVGARLAQLELQGQIQTYLFDPASLGKLNAESSTAFNFGVRAEIFRSLVADVNLFYNSVDNLIETQLVALTTANQSIYSYRNIKRTYTEGLESNFTYAFTGKLNLSLGYQLLYAKDKDVEDQVKKGEVYWRDPETLVTQRLKPGEYFGLYNRSRHMGNVKLFYFDKQKGLEASLRVIYRGRYGVGDIRASLGDTSPSSDRNSNNILDTYDNFVSGYALVNVSVAKTLPGGFRFQVGADNLFNYTDTIYIPNIPGRLLYASISYSFSNNKSKKQ